MTEYRFTIPGKAGALGIQSHVIKAETKAEAWARFCRAYPDRECVKISIQKPRSE